jgi:hypothetical protein
MKTAQEFLTEFVREIVKHPMERQELIAEWAMHMEIREETIRNNPMQYICGFCGQIAENKQQLMNHQSLHYNPPEKVETS